MDEYASMEISEETHFSGAFKIFDEMRASGEMCDVVLCTDDGMKMPAHRVILSACSPYFRAMFSSDFIEAHQPNVNIRAADGLSLQCMIDYFYTNHLYVNYANVEGIIQLAKVMHMEDLVDKCEVFLRRNLSVKNSLGLEAFASHYQLCNLKAHATRYNSWYFLSVKEEEEFLYLPFASLQRLIQNDGLKAPSEEYIFESVIKWLFFNFDSRKQHIPEILPYIRFPLMNLEYLLTSQTIKLLIDNFSLGQVYITQAVQIQNSSKDTSEIANVCPPRYASEDIYVIGGWSNGQKLDSVQCFNVDTLQWTTVQNMNVAHVSKEDYFRVIVSRDQLYTIYVNRVMKYDPVDRAWCKVAYGPDMACKWSGVCECNGIIYVISGNSLRISKKFDTETLEWSVLPEMNQSRYYPAVAVLDEKVYAIGGLDHNWNPMRSCEFYDPSQNTWTDIARMRVPRWSFGVAVLKKRIYAIGGNDRDEQLANTVEIYDPRLDAWERSNATLNYGRRCLGIAVVNDSIYVVGGRVANTIECYNLESDEWKVVGSTQACCNFGCVALRII